MFAKLNNSIRKFHSNEEGLGTLPVILILAFVAIALFCIVAGKAAKQPHGVQVQLGNTVYYVRK